MDSESVREGRGECNSEAASRHQSAAPVAALAQVKELSANVEEQHPEIKQGLGMPGESLARAKTLGALWARGLGDDWGTYEHLKGFKAF